MKLRNLSIATIILLLIGLGFSSCDDERERYYWTDAKVVSDIRVYPDREGHFDTDYDIIMNRNVLDTRDRNFWDVRDIKYFGGDIELISSDDFYGARIQLIYRDRVVSEYPFGNGSAGRNVYRGVDVERFQRDVAEYLRRDGSAKLFFIGDARFTDSYLDVSIVMDVEAYVRD